MQSQPPSYPFSEICLLLQDTANFYALGELIKSFGFTVYVFESRERLSQRLAEQPLTAAVVCQESTEYARSEIRKGYHGPIINLAGTNEQVIEQLTDELRRLHRDQMKIQDVAVVRVLRKFQSFISGDSLTLFLHGPSEGLERAYEYLELFSGRPLELTSDFDPNTIVDQTDVFFVTRDLFGQELEFQRNWELIFGNSKRPHVILDEADMAELDERYENGQVNEFLFERLSMTAVDVSPLAKYTTEELCVQPPRNDKPVVIMDSETEDKAPAVERKNGGSRPPILQLFRPSFRKKK